MATLRLKPRTKPATGNIKDAAAAMKQEHSAEQRGEVPQGAGATPAIPSSLREYLKTGH
jgi:hypothetical protein